MSSLVLAGAVADYGSTRVLGPLDLSLAPGERLPDLVFVDPPYHLIPEIAPRLFARLGELLAGHAEALVVFELPGGTELAPVGWTCVKELGRGARQPTVRIFRQGNT